MSKRIKPNAEHRIVDGEIVSDSSGEQSTPTSQSKTSSETIKPEPSSVKTTADKSKDQPDKSAEKSESALRAEKSVLKAFMINHSSKVYWGGLAGLVIVAVYLTRPDSDWQIQKINELQSEVAQLKQQQKTLQTGLEEQETVVETKVQQALDSLQKETESGSGVLQQLEDKWATELQGIQQSLAGVVMETDQKLSQLMASATNTSQAAPNSSGIANEALSSELKSQLQVVEQAFQQQLASISNEIASLSAFKEEQKALNRKPLKLEADDPLDGLQIQQWIVEINTQWVLSGQIAETSQKLLALEQAASLSDFSFTTQLARLIGEDLSYLKQLETQQVSNPRPDTANLMQAINSLVLKPRDTGQQDSNEPIADNTVSEGSMDKLIERFSQLITVKKRDEDSEITAVNRLLVNDVMKQRLALMVDRLEWGLETHSKQIVMQAVKDIKSYIQQNFPMSSAEFNGLLEPFVYFKFMSRRNLSIVKLDQAVQ